MSCPVVRWQIVSPQPDAVATFYSTLFGWKIQHNNALGYRELRSGDSKGIDGGVWPAPQEVERGFVQLFVEVPDLDRCIADALRLGAKVIVPTSQLPDGDSIAVLLDPTGVPVAICRLGSGPAERR
jgi:predicted enzyme related to lactoylglutathione lyase